MRIINIGAVILISIGISSFSGCSNVVDDSTHSAIPQRIEMQEAVNKKHNVVRPDDIKVTLSLVNSKVVLNQPITVKFLVENDSVLPIRLDLGANFKENFLFTLVYPDGTNTDLPQYSLPQMGSIHAKGNVSVEPKKTYARTFILNEWADLNKTGTYRVEGKLTTPAETIDGNSIKMLSFKMEFKLEPEDTKYIEELCKSYLDRLDNADYSEADEIGIALSFFKSPAALPYMKKALSSKNLLPYNMINYLRDRPTDVGVYSLIAFIKEQPESDSTNYAKSALEFIKNTTKDRRLKLKIESALTN